MIPVIGDELIKTANLITNDLIWDWDILKGKLDWYGNIDSNLGYKKGKFPRKIKTWRNIIHRDDYERVNAALEKHLKSGKPFNEEYRVIRKDKSIIFWGVRGQAFWDKDGKPLRMIGSVRDVTKHRENSRKLIYFEKAVESSSDAIGMATPKGEHYYQNKAFDKLFGMNVKEVKGDNGPPTVYVDENIGKEVFKTIMGGNAWTGEVRMYNKRKEILYISLRAYPIMDKTKKIIGLVGVHTDISARKKMEDELRKMNDELKKFNNLVINRELKMIELKERIKMLESSKKKNKSH